MPLRDADFGRPPTQQKADVARRAVAPDVDRRSSGRHEPVRPHGLRIVFAIDGAEPVSAEHCCRLRRCGRLAHPIQRNKRPDKQEGHPLTAVGERSNTQQGFAAGRGQTEQPQRLVRERQNGLRPVQRQRESRQLDAARATGRREHSAVCGQHRALQPPRQALHRLALGFCAWPRAVGATRCADFGICRSAWRAAGSRCSACRICASNSGS